MKEFGKNLEGCLECFLVFLFPVFLQFDTLKQTDLCLASLKLPAGDIIAAAKWKVVFPGEKSFSSPTINGEKRSVFRFISCGESGGARGSGSAARGNAKLFEL